MFLLDDHEVVRQGLRALLESSGDIVVVGESGLAQEAAARIPALRPDVAVLDARLPDGSGIEVCRTVRGVDPAIKALILTSYDDDEALFAAIMAGAAGYVLKEITGQDLIGAVHQVAAGNSLIDPALTARVLERVRNGPGTAPELAGLTEQELKLLALIAEGLTNRQIGERMFLAEKTVKNYVSSILAKLGLERRTQAAVLASQAAQPRRATPDPAPASVLRARLERGVPVEHEPVRLGRRQLEVAAQQAARSPRVAQPALARRPRPSPTPSSRTVSRSRVLVDHDLHLDPGRRARAGRRWTAPHGAPGSSCSRRTSGTTVSSGPLVRTVGE